MFAAIKKVTTVLGKFGDKLASIFARKVAVHGKVVHRRSREEVRESLIRNIDSRELMKWSAISEQYRTEYLMQLKAEQQEESARQARIAQFKEWCEVNNQHKQLSETIRRNIRN